MKLEHIESMMIKTEMERKKNIYFCEIHTFKQDKGRRTGGHWLCIQVKFSVKNEKKYMQLNSWTKRCHAKYSPVYNTNDSHEKQ